MNSDPIALIKRLEQQYADYGAVKLTASDDWNFPFNFGNVDKAVTVRKQVLQDLTKAKVVAFSTASLWKRFLVFIGYAAF